MHLFDHDLSPPPPAQPQPRLFDEWLDVKGEEIWCNHCKCILRSDECTHRKPLRPTALSEIESPRRRRFLSTGLNGVDRILSPPSLYIDPITGLMDPPNQPVVQQEVYQTLDTTISRKPTPYLDPPRTPPRSNRNLAEIHEELDFNIFDRVQVTLREAGNPFLESTPTKKRLSSPTSPETPRRSKRLQIVKDSEESLPQTPSRIGLVDVDQNMASPVSPKKRSRPRTSAKENGRGRPVSSPRKRRSSGNVKALRLKE